MQKKLHELYTYYMRKHKYTNKINERKIKKKVRLFGLEFI